MPPPQSITMMAMAVSQVIKAFLPLFFLAVVLAVSSFFSKIASLHAYLAPGMKFIEQRPLPFRYYSEMLTSSMSLVSEISLLSGKSLLYLFPGFGNQEALVHVLRHSLEFGQGRGERYLFFPIGIVEGYRQIGVAEIFPPLH
jgi:hypothetical protein